ncbi:MULTISPECIES: hypothetical protein [unclassified Wolbachia]|uniref:hypothetical protein n=1 Tax=unclassified Wolbachia TaxID=2640676 RepID=UPI0007EE9833|nr:hypothetical protein [Wolbachia endosymbiont of Nomada ferruginata]
MSNGDGLIRSLVDGDLEGFRQGFESFLDQYPSFLYHVSAGRFLPVFFFSMFSTAHDANILNANERVYFRFDNHGVNPRNGENRNTANLKVAVYRDGQQVVRCYSISDRSNSDGLRFSTRERNALVREIRRQNPNLREEDLNFEQYKVCMHGKGKSQGEAIATVFEAIREKDFRDRDKFAKYSASEINFLRQLLGNNMTIKQINRIQLNQNQRAQLDNLVNFAQVAHGQRRQIRDILGNQGIEVNDLLTLEFATRNGHYDYWLQQIDIAYAGRLRYQLRTEGNHTFEVANLARNDGNEHIVRVLNQFRENEEQQRLTLIITLNNTHWVTLVIERQNGNYVGYYADSTATAVPGGIIDIIQNNLGNNIRINNVSVRQQTDGWNCGLWALENATDINRVLNENPGEQVQNVVNIMRDFLGRGHPNRDRNYFQNIRVSISQLFRNDPGFQDVQLQAYIQNREQIDQLLRTYLELGYHRVGGGCGPVEAPISLSVSDSSNFGGLPQSSLEGPEASRISDLSKGKGGR